MPDQTNKDPDIKDLIKSISECHQVCLDSISYCLDMGGDHAEAGHITTLMDCAKICETSADYLLRDSGFSPLPVEICSAICDECEKSCNEFKDDQVMKTCAKMCEECKGKCSEYTAQFEEEC